MFPKPQLRDELAKLGRFTLDDDIVLLPEQQFIRAYMSPDAPYRGLLAFHKLGSGKTYVAAVLAADYLEEGRDVFYLGHGTGVINNFKDTYFYYIGNSGSINHWRRIVKLGLLAFTNNIRKYSARLNGSLIIVDEAHHLRLDAKRYKEIKKVFDEHLNAKILLMTGTPMVDDAEELDHLLDLIGPDTPISYHDKIEDGPTVRFQSNMVIGSYKVLTSEMIGIQLSTYKDKMSLNDIYSSVHQISVGVSSTGRYSGSSNAMDIRNIREQSCKFHEVQKYLKQGELSLIFTQYVQGSGVHFIGKMLEHIGFVKYGNQGNRVYAVCSGDEPHIRRTIEMFTSHENRHGSIIEVLVGSRVISESYTMPNIRHVHVLTPYWNSVILDQLTARATRMRSHSQLDESEQDVCIYLHVAVARGIQTVDQIQYERIRRKDTEIRKNIQRCIKENINTVMHISLDQEVGTVNRHIIEYEGQQWDVTDCLARNRYQISHDIFDGRKARIFIQNTWYNRALPNWVRLSQPTVTSGYVLVKSIVDGRLRIRYMNDEMNSHKVQRGVLLQMLRGERLRKLLDTFNAKDKSQLIEIMKDSDFYHEQYIINM